MGFCGWDVIIPDSLTAEWNSESPTVRDAAQDAACHILWGLTGRVFGVCDTVARPCFSPAQGNTYDGRGGRAWWPGVGLGNPGASGACGCRSGCTHVPDTKLWLRGPVHEVTRVVIDGAALDTAAYRVDKRRWLIRQDGQSWPHDQDLSAPPDGEGAFTVYYRIGVPVPDAGKLAAGRLAVEIARGMKGSPCELPAHVASVARQGITIDFDPRGYFENGMTGIDSIDQWVMAVNPYRSKRPARISSPDRPRG